jgi:hypothetical protein
MKNTTVAINTPTGENENYLLGQVKRLYSEPKPLTPCLSGESSSTIADKQESTALCSGMKARIEAQTSYDKRIELLTASGLIAGITPLYVRKRLNPPTPASALLRLAGASAGAQNLGCEYLKD